MNIKKEIKRVEELGEQIGYGNMMSIASALWRKKLKDSGTPVSGAFVPTCLPFIKDECQDLGKGSREMYDSLVDKLSDKPSGQYPYIHLIPPIDIYCMARSCEFPSHFEKWLKDEQNEIHNTMHK